MSTIPEDQGAPIRPIDVAKRRSWPWRPSQANWVWVVVFLLLLAYFGLNPTREIVPVVWVLAGLAVLLVAWIGWLAFRNGLFTWMRLARAPARALSRGDDAGAERAFAVALERARRFSPHDYRRALMVVELAGYLARFGRSSEAKALYQEGIDILRQQWKSRPQEYFTALNNFAVYLIDFQDFAAAQPILEQLLDLTLFWRKGGIQPHAAASSAPLIDLVVHLNLVVLFVRMEALDLAADRLEAADALFSNLVKPKRLLGDYYHGIRALLLQAQGNLPMAAGELDKVRDQELPICMSVRAKLSLAKGEFAQAEQLVRKHLDREARQGPVHRPTLRQQVLDLAESLFGQSKYDEAFKALEEARAITRDFALPPSSPWRKALASWLERAGQLARVADVAELEADLYRLSTTPEQAITISPRLRIRPPG